MGASYVLKVFKTAQAEGKLDLRTLKNHLMNDNVFKNVRASSCDFLFVIFSTMQHRHFKNTELFALVVLKTLATFLFSHPLL